MLPNSQFFGEGPWQKISDNDLLAKEANIMTWRAEEGKRSQTIAYSLLFNSHNRIGNADKSTFYR